MAPESVEPTQSEQALIRHAMESAGFSRVSVKPFPDAPGAFMVTGVMEDKFATVAVTRGDLTVQGKVEEVAFELAQQVRFAVAVLGH